MALDEQRAEVAAIVANPELPTFQNTIVAMERTGRTLDRVARLFGVARESVTTPEYQALEREWQPKLAAAADAIDLNPQLFQRIEAVHQSLPGTDLGVTRGRHNLSCLDRAAQVAAVNRRNLRRRQPLSQSPCLLHAARRECRVELTDFAPLGIPLGLSVAHDDQPHLHTLPTNLIQTCPIMGHKLRCTTASTRIWSSFQAFQSVLVWPIACYSFGVSQPT